MSIITPRKLSGFMELTPDKQVYFDSMVQTLRTSFSLFGFTALDTPLMDASEVLLAKAGGDTDKQVYTLRKGDTDLALRYELTTSLAKYVATYYSDLTFPFRRFEIGKVYRGERAQKGRYREFYQADIDIIGDGNLDILNDAEIPSVIYNSLSSLGLSDFVIHINNRKVLSGFFDIIGVTDKSTEILRTIDKLGKIGKDKIAAMLKDDLLISATQADKIVEFVSSSDTPFETLAEYKGMNDTFDIGAGELSLLRSHLLSLAVPETHFSVDLSIARGLDYYTGSVFETYLTSCTDVGSICSGGRYDDLAGCFSKRTMPGVGISIGLTRLFSVLQDRGMLCDTFLSAPADVMIIPMTDSVSYALSVATTMRTAGIRVQLYNEEKKFKNKVSYADKMKIPFVVFLGEDEVNSGQVTVKDMTTGNQTTASLALLTAGIADKISQLRNATPVRRYGSE